MSLTKTSLFDRVAELRAFFLASLSVIADFFPFSSVLFCVSLLTMALVWIFARCVAPLVRICDVLCPKQKSNAKLMSILRGPKNNKLRHRNVDVHPSDNYNRQTTFEQAITHHKTVHKSALATPI